MSTNKTRLSFYDKSAANPDGVVIVNEFDIYQEAFDYANTFAKRIALTSSNYSWEIMLFSYDNTSYMWEPFGGVSEPYEIVFPVS